MKKKLTVLPAAELGTFAILSHATGSLVGHENTRRWTVRCHKGL